MERVSSIPITMQTGAGMSYIAHQQVLRAYQPFIAELQADFFRQNLQRKKDPFSPASRSKGEKARNRRKRI